jgi:hypothetical protein
MAQTSISDHYNTIPTNNNPFYRHADIYSTYEDGIYVQIQQIAPFKYQMTIQNKNGTIQYGDVKIIDANQLNEYISPDEKGMFDYDGKTKGGSSTGEAAPIEEDWDQANEQDTELNDPLVFDLDGDHSLSLTSTAGGINFDHDNDGFAQLSAWVAKGDGILCLDRNNNGTIDSGLEIFGNNTKLQNGQYASGGFAALSELDTNNDGIIDANDTDFANLKFLLADGSLITMEEAGIASIDLTPTLIDGPAMNDNWHWQQGTFTRDDNSTGTFGEIWLGQEYLLAA